jgi:hypothetical protein
MRSAFLVFAALSLAGCFRIAQGGPEDGTGTSASPVDCVYGKIASVPGLPLGIASTGKTVFVVSADVGGVIGDLRAITSDGAVHLVVQDNAYVGMAVFGSTLAFNRRIFDQQQNFLSATVELVNSDFTTTTIDSTNANVAQVDSLASDGTSLYWYRWAPPSNPFEAANTGTPTIAKYDSGSTTIDSLDPSVVSPQGLVTDGTNFFSVFNLPDSFEVVGKLPVDGSSPVVLGPNDDGHSLPASSVVGVDDTNVVYLSGGADAWAVPKNGGAATPIASDEALTNSAVLYDHHLYWSDQNPDGSGSILRVSTSGVGTEPVVSSTTPIPALASDSCGVVYATTDSANPGASATSIYRVKF